MSIEMIQPAIDTEGLTHAEKLVLIILASHAHPDGTNAFPSIATMATETSLNRTSVQRNIRNLEAKGLIVAIGYRYEGETIIAPPEDLKGGRNHVTVYTVFPSINSGAVQIKGGAVRPIPPINSGATDLKGGAVQIKGGAVRPEPSLEPSIYNRQYSSLSIASQIPNPMKPENDEPEREQKPKEQFVEADDEEREWFSVFEHMCADLDIRTTATDHTEWRTIIATANSENYTLAMFRAADAKAGREWTKGKRTPRGIFNQRYISLKPTSASPKTNPAPTAIRANQTAWPDTDTPEAIAARAAGRARREARRASDQLIAAQGQS